jgi:hypothetical protein
MNACDGFLGRGMPEQRIDERHRGLGRCVCFGVREGPHP